MARMVPVPCRVVAVIVAFVADCLWQISGARKPGYITAAWPVCMKTLDAYPSSVKIPLEYLEQLLHDVYGLLSMDLSGLPDWYPL